MEFEPTYTAQLPHGVLCWDLCVWDLFFNLVTIFPFFFFFFDSGSHITSHHGYKGVGKQALALIGLGVLSGWGGRGTKWAFSLSYSAYW